ncbi:MAG: DNA methyltransferase [Candidatus Babeliales bacterium]
MNPYYQDKYVTIFNCDCRDILPSLEPVDLVLTDPPYGINKAEWDSEFPIWWMDQAYLKTAALAFTPGTWNLMSCPKQIGNLKYKWTLAAHLINGMTRGGFGFGNWIPCVVYQKDADEMPEEVQQWCKEFNEWCIDNNITKNDLNRICGTSDMGGWWLGLLPHRCQIPAPHQWEKIKSIYNPPASFDFRYISDFAPKSDCKDFVVGTNNKPQHPSPKPVEVITWFLQCLKGDFILDPFLGSGTTAYCAKKLQRRCVGIEIEEKYCEIAARRCQQEVMELNIEPDNQNKQELLL